MARIEVPASVTRVERSVAIVQGVSQLDRVVLAKAATLGVDPQADPKVDAVE